MKFTALLVILTSAFPLIIAAPGGTNAERLARGEPILPPKHLYVPSKTGDAKRAVLSSLSLAVCPAGNLQCCDSMLTLNDDLLEPPTNARPGTLVGQLCRTIDSTAGVGDCPQDLLCCDMLQGDLRLNCVIAVDS